MALLRLLAVVAIIAGPPALVGLIIWEETRPTTMEDLRREVAIFQNWRAAVDQSAHLENLVGLCHSARKTNRTASDMRERERASALLDIASIKDAARIAARCAEHKVPSRYRLDEMKSTGRRNTADRLVGVDIR